MKLLRHALFAFLLLLAQSGALTHGVEHLRVDGDAPASHSCSYCVAAQGLDVPLAATPENVALSAAGFAPRQAPSLLFISPRPPRRAPAHRPNFSEAPFMSSPFACERLHHRFGEEP